MDDFDSSYDTPLKCDYNNSFLLWSITAKDHTPRSALQASCKIRGRDEAFREYFLGSSCAGEQMYVEKNLIQLPTAEVNKIFSLNDEHMIIKYFAEPPGILQVAHRLGEKMPTHDGTGAVVTKFEYGMRYFTEVLEMTTYEEVYHAVINNKPILGRTRYIDHRNGDHIEVVSEYPVSVINVRHEHQIWQVDAGPVILPDFTIEEKLEVSVFRQAFLVYNRWDYAEYVMQLPILHKGADHPTVHYTNPKPLDARNQLFVVNAI